MSAIEPGTSPPMVVLRPGDHVLVTLQDSFPGVEFVVMDGVVSILVGGP